MKIKLSIPYKSIRVFDAIELPNFVVLTGVNGSGKSHFLQALENNHLTIEEFPHNPNTRNIRRFEWSNMVPNDSGAYAGYQAKQERAQMWQQLSSLSASLLQPLQQLTAQYSALSKLSVKQIPTLTYEDLATKGIANIDISTLYQNIQNVLNNVDLNVTQHFVSQDPGNRPRFISGLRASTALKLIALEEEDFYESFPLTWQPVDMFQQSFARLFAEYQSNKTRNELKQFLNSRGAKHRFYTNDEFTERYGVAPWDFVNEILQTAKLNFKINAPDEFEDRPYEPSLTDDLNGTQIKFNDLSSGEKILMSFALCLYYARDNRQIVEYPQVLLFDEIDAPLHPSMTQSLLQTIQKVLIDQHKIKVILTTHSPSTVALAPEESLYVMQKGKAERIVKTSKDRALAILLEGVPSLSMHYKNRRQIFTESNFDAEFYESIYSKIKSRLIPEISLEFIAAGSSKDGGCARVKTIVQSLYQAGNQTVFGLIDWDKLNKAEGRTYVFGLDLGYSIENFIIDPLLVSILLLRERFISREDLKLGVDENSNDFSKFSEDRLQVASDFLVNHLADFMSRPKEDRNFIREYVSGAKLRIPEWYCMMQGHELEKKIKETFPQLKTFHRTGDLSRALISKIMDDHPMLIPKTFLDTFSEIQKA